MQTNVNDATFNDLAADYDRYRVGYSSEVFDMLEEFGLRRGANVLDLGCGTGLSMEPLAARGMAVTGIDPSTEMLAAARARVPGAQFVEGHAERLPFSNAMFDGAVSAQTFHWLDADAAFSEIVRVVKPGGTVGVWWKMLSTEERMRTLRATACKNIGVEASPDPLRGGFGAFYRAPFAQRAVRVVPFVTRFTVEDWLGYERSRANARNAYGSQREAYLQALREQMIATFGNSNARIAVRYLQYLYIGITGKA